MSKDEIKKEESAAVKEYLARGGKITVCEPNARTENIVLKWQKGPRKKAE